MLELHDQNGVLMETNDNWKENQAEVEATGLAPTDDRESVIVTTLSPGNYTAIVLRRERHDRCGPGRSLRHPVTAQSPRREWSARARRDIDEARKGERVRERMEPRCAIPGVWIGRGRFGPGVMNKIKWNFVVCRTLANSLEKIQKMSRFCQDLVSGAQGI